MKNNLTKVLNTFKKLIHVPRWFLGLALSFKDMVTDKEGTTVVPARVYWLLGASISLFLSVWSVIIQNQPFSMTDFGTGFGAILIAGGAGVWLTHKTEPS